MKFIYFFFILLLVGSDMLILTLIHKRNAKKCSYDCLCCKNWDCMKLYCDKKRKEFLDEYDS